jgi:diacylglycerol kinase (ATP)
VRHRKVDVVRTASLRIEAPGINAYADGEFLGPLPAEVRVRPAAAQVLLPPQ